MKNKKITGLFLNNDKISRGKRFQRGRDLSIGRNRKRRNSGVVVTRDAHVNARGYDQHLIAVHERKRRYLGSPGDL